jgi:hypothetical protein
MKIISSVLLAALPISAAYSDEPSPDARIEATKGIKIPLPKITPYDADSEAKAVYLQEYTKAYRLILAAVLVDCHMGIKGYYENAFQDGWVDGRSAAIKDHPEKAAQIAKMQGISLEDFLKIFKKASASQKQAEQGAAANP